MTRTSKKQQELDIVLELLHMTGMRLDSEPEESETPDFMVQVAGRAIGIEVTMFQSGDVIKRAGKGALRKRLVESEWERLEACGKVFRKRDAEFRNTYILFRFKSVVPPREEYQNFFDEVLQFLRSTPVPAIDEFKIFGIEDFTGPIMKEYLNPVQGLALKRSDCGEWDSNLTAGYVADHPATVVSGIVEGKSAKQYRNADELLLVIAQSGRPSEMVLPITGPDAFNENRQLQQGLESSPFSKVYLLTALGLLWWDKSERRWQSSGR